jgi:hypothetical protein
MPPRAPASARTGSTPAPEGDLFGVNTRLVGTYESYREAEQAVDLLADHGLPVQGALIVGRGLRSVERVTGQLTRRRAALRSAISGAILGAVFGWLLGLLDVIDPVIFGLVLALCGAVVGGTLAALLGAAGHALTAGRRDFASVGYLQADSYHLLIDAGLADAATKVLRHHPGDADSGRTHRLGPPGR